MDETITPSVGFQLCNAAKTIPGTTKDIRKIDAIETTTTVRTRSIKEGSLGKKITEVTVEDRFYTLGEYKNLTDKQTQKLGWLRDHRDYKSSANNTSNISSINIEKMVVDRVEAALAKINTSSISSVGTENIGNQALSRQSILRHANI